MAHDPIKNTIWIFSDASIFEVVVTNEDRDVWQLYLSNGKYDEALKHAKDETQSDRIHTQARSASLLFILTTHTSSEQSSTSLRVDSTQRRKLMP